MFNNLGWIVKIQEAHLTIYEMAHDLANQSYIFSN